MKFQAIKGMSDLVCPEIELWQAVETKTRSFFQQRLFQEIRTPIVEYTELFSRSIGESSDIVHKEMYTFEDRGGRSLTLRPEMTASCVRAAIENRLLQEGDITRLFYIGPMFRAEKPQAGRRRQFHQIGLEVFGSSDPLIDAQVIAILKHYFDFLGLSRYTIRVNNLGSAESRKTYLAKLKPFLDEAKNALCEDCHFRLTKNVLRVFDCKNKACQGILKDAPKIFDAVDDASKDRFDEVLQFLKALETPVTIDKDLVRGLDYYADTVFEVSCEDLGAQDAIGAGGRYDDLVKQFGGPKMGATGFAIGMERLMEALQKQKVIQVNDSQQSNLIYLANVDRAVLGECLSLAMAIQKRGGQAMLNDLGKSLKGQFRQADKWKARYVVVLGEQEIKTGQFTVKDLKEGKEFKVSQNNVVDQLLNNT